MLLLLFQVQEEANRCPSPVNCTLPNKQVIIRLQENSTYEDYMYVAFGTICVYSLIFCVTIAVSYVEFRYVLSHFEELDVINKKRKAEKNHQLINETIQRLEILRNAFGQGNGEGKEVNEEDQLFNVSQKLLKHQKVVGQFSSKEGQKKSEAVEMENLFTEDFFIDLDQLDGLGVEVNERHKNRLKRDLTISDLSKKLNDKKKNQRSKYEKSKMYWECALVVSIYYSIPTVQMVLDTNQEYDFTGNQDLCFLNNACTKPLGQLKDFGSTFSNLGYIVLGILFISIVRMKGQRYSSLQTRHANFDPCQHGVPQQNGVYYAMGAALIMEGIMSTIYHVCPTTLAFQFDTTYMYLIAILMFVKLFQARHPDLSLNAFEAYMGLGIALTLEAFSYYFHGLPFWIVFCTVYMAFVIIISVVTYSLGAVKYDYKIIWSVAKVVFVELRGTCGSALGNGQCQAPVFRARWQFSSKRVTPYVLKDCLLVCDGQRKPLPLPLFCFVQRCLRLQLPAGSIHGEPFPLPQLLCLHEALLRRKAFMELPCICHSTSPHIHSIALLLSTGLKH